MSNIESEILVNDSNLTHFDSWPIDESWSGNESWIDLSADSSLLTNESTHHFPKDMLGFTASSAFIIAIFGTFGNLLTIIALPLNKKLRTTATAFVVNLAVVELLFCVLILPMSGAQYAYLQYHTESLLSDSDCVFFAMARYTFTQVELQTIVAIALTRSFAVGFPSFYKRIDNKWVTGVYICLIWIYSFALKIPILLGVFGVYVFNPKTMECDVGRDPMSKFARFIAVIVEVIIPMLLIIILYIFIFIMVKLSTWRVSRACRRASGPSTSSASETAQSTSLEGQSKRNFSGRSYSIPTYKALKRMVSDSSNSVPRSSISSTRSKSNRRDMRVARTIFIIFVMIIICSIPVAVVHTIDSEGKQPRRLLAVHILYWLQYCLNVVVYVLMNKQYRVAYIELLSKIVPSCEEKKTFLFPWENNSLSTRPGQGYNGNNRSRRGSSSQDGPSVISREYKPVDTKPRHSKQGRLPAIIEVNSSTGTLDDEVYKPDKMDNKREFISCSGSNLDEHSETYSGKSSEIEYLKNNIENQNKGNNDVKLNISLNSVNEDDTVK